MFCTLAVTSLAEAKQLIGCFSFLMCDGVGWFGRIGGKENAILWLQLTLVTPKCCFYRNVEFV